MLRTVIVEATYPEDPDLLFDVLRDLSEMKSAMSSIAVYHGLPDGRIEQGDSHQVNVTMFGWLRTRAHRMTVERLDVPGRLIQSRESNPQVSRWDHTLTVEPAAGGALWRDLVVLDAGWQTPITARFCRYVYAHRHKARRAETIEARILRGDHGTPLRSPAVQG